MLRLNKKKMIALAIMAAMTTSLTACGTQKTSSQTAQKCINVGITNSPSDLNPIDPGDNAANYAVGLLYQPLLELDDDMTFKPMLADSVKTTDNKTFTVKLNEKAKWTDDKPVTADDLLFTVKLIANPKTTSMIASNFAILEGFDDKGHLKDGVEPAGVKKVDDHTIEFKTKTSVSTNIFNNGISRNIMTVPKHVFKDVDPASIRKHEQILKPKVTDGPFKLVSYEKDQAVQYEANKGFFKGAPKVDKLNLKVIHGSDMAVQLQSGEIDMNMPSVGTIPVEDYEKVKSIDKVKTESGKPSNIQFLFVNNKTLADARIRQAISCAVDRKVLVDKLLKGQGEVTDSFFTSTNPYLNKNLKTTAFDIEKAKQLVKESGFDTAKVIKFNVPTGNKTREQAADIIAENLKAIGLNIQIQKFDFATTMSKCKTHDYDITLMGDTLIPVDPTYDLPFFVTTGNYCEYTNKEVDNIVAAVKTEVDDNKVKADLGKMQEILAKDVPMPILYATHELFATNKRIVNGKAKDYGVFINVNEWDIK